MELDTNAEREDGLSDCSNVCDMCLSNDFTFRLYTSWFVEDHLNDVGISTAALQQSLLHETRILISAA